MPVRVAVCEDEKNLRDEISNLINSEHGTSLDCYESGEALLASGKEYELYILDIQMPGIDGMELAETIRAGQRSASVPTIIFTTAFREHMQKAFDVKAYHFLLKPLDKEKFLAVFRGAVSELAGRRRLEHMTVSVGRAAHTVTRRGILYIESNGKKVTVHTITGVLECSGKLREFEQALSESPMFFRCHRCYIVNMEHISRYNSKMLTMTDGQEIFIAREKYRTFVSAFTKFAMK